MERGKRDRNNTARAKIVSEQEDLNVIQLFII